MLPRKAPENFPIEAIITKPRVSSASLPSLRMVRSAARPERPKNIGMKKAEISPCNCCWIWPVRIGDWPIKTPAMKAPRTVRTPRSWVISAIPPMITRMAVITGNSLRKCVIDPADDREDQPAPYGEAEDQKQRHAAHALDQVELRPPGRRRRCRR